jgi:hypothetical protein
MNLLQEWYRASMAILPEDVAIWDAHTHTGANDPDGMVGHPGHLLSRLDQAGHAGCVLITSQEPDGYPPANDRILSETEAAPGRFLPFLRVDPNLGSEALAEAERCLDLGFVGIKLHPRGEDFPVSHPVVSDLAGLATDSRVPILLHAGRGIPSLGPDVVDLLDAHADLNVILAHAAISDLSWLAPVVDAYPGLFFDTAWWSTAALIRLFTVAPASQILYASDTPYGRPFMSGTLACRVAGAARYEDAALRAVFGGNLESLVRGDRPPHLSSIPDESLVPDDPLLVGLYADLHGAIGEILQGCDASQAMSLARLTCNVRDDHPYSETLSAIAASLDRLETVDHSRDHRSAVGRPLIAVASAALTPEQPVPDVAGWPAA